MTSDPYRARRVFVWKWLPDESVPVVAGFTQVFNKLDQNPHTHQNQAR